MLEDERMGLSLATLYLWMVQISGLVNLRIAILIYCFLASLFDSDTSQFADKFK